MAYQYTDDPARDWDAYCEEQERKAKKLPICSQCGERIYDDYVYVIDGELYCEDCIDECREPVEHYIED